MKKQSKLILLTVFCLFACISCEKNLNGKRLNGKLISNTDCKSFLKSSFPDSVSCIEYAWDETNNTLNINHINAGFNCCPESLWCNISLKNDTIIFHEFEKSASCKCNCLYDLDMEVNGVSSKKYFLKFVEPYCGEQKKLFFEIDLSEETEGLACVKRKQYPWGIFSGSQ